VSSVGKAADSALAAVAVGENIRRNFETDVTLSMEAKRTNGACCGPGMFQMNLFAFILPKETMKFVHRLKSSLRISLDIALSVKGTRHAAWWRSGQL
jgi:hypothetical protein